MHIRRVWFNFVVLLAFFAIVVTGLPADDGFRVLAPKLLPDEPTIPGRSAILVEMNTSTELLSLAADESIPPASLTKIVAVHVVMEAIENGEISPEEVVPIPMTASAAAMPPNSSLMFLDSEQRVTMTELLYGLIVSSGNDAAVAVALHLSGSVEQFVARMNRTVQLMGLTKTRFADPSGLSAQNTTTAREFARFLLNHLRRFPRLRDDLYSVAEFAYPKPHNLPEGVAAPMILQRNRNLLVHEDPRVDGVKTGYIDESGYNIAVSASEGTMDLLTIVLGIEAPDHRTGGRLRANAAQTLIDYGFDRFALVEPSPPPIDPVRVWEGTVDRIVPTGATTAFVVPRDAVRDLSGMVYQLEEVTAPVSMGQKLGRVVYMVGEEEVYTAPLTAPRGITNAGMLSRLWDRLLRFFASLSTGPSADSTVPAGS